MTVILHAVLVCFPTYPGTDMLCATHTSRLSWWRNSEKQGKQDSNITFQFTLSLAVVTKNASIHFSFVDVFAHVIKSYDKSRMSDYGL